MSRDLPEAAGDRWRRPAVNVQPTLFPKLADEVLAGLGVERGDARRWRELGWLSFDVDAAKHIDEPEEWEVAFVRNIARSNLSLRQIDELLADLPKPFRYDPVATAYHFEHGWGTPRKEDPFDVIDREVEDWVNDLAQNGRSGRLEALLEAVSQALASMDEGRE